MIWRHSPNFNRRRQGQAPSTVVIHYTGMDSTEAALDRLCDPQFEVSAHYLIAPKGEVYNMVEEGQRAWHAGAGTWGNCNDLNSASIGIELCNAGDHPFDPAQMAALCELLQGILQRWNIAPQRVIGHSDLAPMRKIDPGVHFNWQYFASKGLSIWPTPFDGNIEGFWQNLHRFGYAAPNDEQERDSVLYAFRSRFRPLHIGDDSQITQQDCDIAASLAHFYPVDQNITGG